MAVEKNPSFLDKALGWLPGIGGLFSAIGGLFGPSQKELMQQEFDNQKGLMAYQAELNEQAVNRQNRYNLPANQVARLKDAGLNMNLLYGNGVANPIQPSAAQTGLNSTTGSSIGASQLHLQRMQAVSDAMLKFAQARNLDSMTKVNDSDKRLKDTQLTGQEYQNKILKVQSDIQENTQAQQEYKFIYEAKLLGAQADIATMQQIRESIQQHKWQALEWKLKSVTSDPKEYKKFTNAMYNSFMALENIPVNENIKLSNEWKKVEEEIKNLKVRTETEEFKKQNAEKDALIAQSIFSLLMQIDNDTTRGIAVCLWDLFRSR